MRTKRNSQNRTWKVKGNGFSGKVVSQGCGDNSCLEGFIDVKTAQHYNESYPIKVESFPSESSTKLSTGEKIKYDTSIKFLKEAPMEEMFFLNGDYLFTRYSAHPGYCFRIGLSELKSLDVIQNPTTHRDVKGRMSPIEHSDLIKSQLNCTRPLVEKMEEILETKLVDSKYYGVFNLYQDYNAENTNVHKFLKPRGL